MLATSLGIALLRAAQARAAMAGRTFVLPDDIKALAVPVLAHRMLVRPEAGPAAGIITTLLQELQAPPEIQSTRARL